MPFRADAFVGSGRKDHAFLATYDAGTCLAVATQWSGVAWANLFAPADSIVDTGKLSLAHATHNTLNTYRRGQSTEFMTWPPSGSRQASCF